MNQNYHQPHDRGNGGQGQERQQFSSILPTAAMNLLQNLNGDQKKILFDALSLFLSAHQHQQQGQGLEAPHAINDEGKLRVQPSSSIAAMANSANHGVQPSLQMQSGPSFAAGTHGGSIDQQGVAATISQLLAQELVLRQMGQGGAQQGGVSDGNLDLLGAIQSLASGRSPFSPQTGIVGGQVQSQGQVQGQGQGQGQGGFHAASSSAAMMQTNNNGFSTVSAGTLTAAAAAAAAAASERSKQEASNFNVPSAFTTTSGVRAQFSTDQNRVIPSGVEVQKKPAAPEIKPAPANVSAALPTPKALRTSAYLTYGYSAADGDSLDDPIKNKMILSCPARKMPWDHNQYTAYFRILPETRHGDELICSYVSCCERGSKFLYCKFCHAAVSKRHFFARHCHTGEAEPNTEQVRKRVEQDKQASFASEHNDENVSHLSDQEPYYELTTSRSAAEAAFSSLSGSGTGSSQQISEIHADATVPSSNLACADQNHDKGAMSSLSSYGNGQNSAQQDQVSTMSSVSSSNETEFKNGHVVDKLPEEDQKDGRSDGASSDTSSTRAVKFPLSKHTPSKKRPFSASVSADHAFSGSTTRGNDAAAKEHRGVGKERLAAWSNLYRRKPKLDDKRVVTGWFVDLLDTSVDESGHVAAKGPKKARKSEDLVEQANRAVQFMKQKIDEEQSKSVLDLHQKSDWNILLECRPALDNNGAVTKWLEQILNFSATGNDSKVSEAM